MAKPKNANVVGKRVYRMGSHAPTRGTVNPLGYVKREQKRQAQARNKARAAKSMGRKAPAKPKTLNPGQAFWSKILDRNRW